MTNETDIVVGSSQSPAQLEKQLKNYGDTRKVLLKFAADQMQEGSDYHLIKGKKSLGKPGAEKFCSLFKVTIGEPELAEDIMATLPSSLRESGAVVLKTKLFDQKGKYMGSGIGARTLKQDQNDINKMMKMARKSSVVDAVISTFGLSDLFTQDLESMPKDTVQNYPKPEQLSEGKKINKETGEITQKSKLTSKGLEMMQKASELMTLNNISEEEQELVAQVLTGVKSKWDYTDGHAEIIVEYASKHDEEEIRGMIELASDPDFGKVASQQGMNK